VACVGERGDAPRIVRVTEPALPTAVVLDVRWTNGLAAIRSLGRAGVPVVAVAHARRALGFSSRYATPFVCPHPVLDEAEYVDALERLGDSLDRPAPLLPTHDEYLNPVARNRERLGDRFRYPFPSWDVLAVIQSKRTQLERARELGIPMPETRYPDTVDEALAAGKELGFPLVVKPSDPPMFRVRFHRQGFRCDSEPELVEAFHRAAPSGAVLQEFIVGGDEELFSLGAYVAEDGEPLGLFCGRKLRQTRKDIGSCRVGEAVWVDEVVQQGLALLRGLEFHGIAQVEFKRDRSTGVYKLIEVNPRLWQWHGLAAACGVDFPRIAYWDLLGARLPPVTTAGASKRWAITLVRDDTPALVRPPYVEPMLARDDLRPALVHGARLLRGPAGRVYRALAR